MRLDPPPPALCDPGAPIELALQSVVSGHANPAAAARFRLSWIVPHPNAQAARVSDKTRGDRFIPVATAGGYTASLVLPWNMRTVMT
jgi:hypothetical protein